MIKNDKKNLEAEEYFRIGLDHLESCEIEQAIFFFRKASSLGLGQAQCSLGTLFDDMIKPSNPKKARYWYKKAVKNGDSMAAYNLSIHYKNKGVRRWQLFWLKRAAEMGNEDALSELNL